MSDHSAFCILHSAFETGQGLAQNRKAAKGGAVSRAKPQRAGQGLAQNRKAAKGRAGSRAKPQSRKGPGRMHGAWSIGNVGSFCILHSAFEAGQGLAQNRKGPGKGLLWGVLLNH